jgi:N-dimethylarginine dimethylaminohydrolase
MWLKEHKYKLIEVPPEELLSCVAVNGMSLGDRKIVMPKAAVKTNALLRKEGVDVIELDTSGLHGLMMGGLRCMTMRLYREPGPRLEELK